MVFLKDILPVQLPYEESLALRHRLINELRSLIEGGAVRSDHVRLLERVLVAHHVFDEAVDFVADFVHALVEEQHFIHFIKLIIKYDALVLAPTLQVLQNIHHEYAVALVVPGEECMPIWIVKFLEAEHLRIGSQKIDEQELIEHCDLNIRGKLVEKLQVLFVFEGLSLIMLPLVVEVRFNSFFEADVNRFHIIESLDGTEEFG